MNLADLTLEIRQVLRDVTIEASIPAWLNDSMLELAGGFELPTLRLHEPATLTTTESAWLYDLTDAVHPSGYEFMKRCFRVSSTEVPTGFTLETDMGLLYDIDPERDDTGDRVQRVVLDGGQLGVYPMADDALSVWFYRAPLPMEDDDDEPDGIPVAFHYRVLIPKVVLRAFRVYPELATESVNDGTQALVLWTQRLHEGLYGDKAQIGLIDYLQKSNRPYGPRVRGPRLGSQLSGGAGRRCW